MTSVVHGERWREALQQVADQADLMLWIDRRVDPTRAVELGQIGPTVFEALRQLANERDCQVMPVADTVLVGRTDWVDRTAASLWRLEQRDSGSQPGEVVWPELTTPSEALRIASGRHAVAASDTPLPHDLWPAVRWNSIDHRVAVSLVLAQFDQQLRDPSSLESLESKPAESRGAFTRRYAAGPGDAEVREAIEQVDRNSRLRKVDQWLEATASPAAHRAATAAWLAQSAAGKRAASRPAARTDQPRFDLRLKNKPAGAVLRQLAAAAGKECKIEPEALAACEQLISLQAQDATLEELAREVAQQAGVQVTWGEESVVVDAAP